VGWVSQEQGRRAFSRQRDLPATDDKHGSEIDFTVDLFIGIDVHTSGQRCNPGHESRGHGDDRLGLQLDITPRCSAGGAFATLAIDECWIRVCHYRTVTQTLGLRKARAPFIDAITHGWPSRVLRV